MMKFLAADQSYITQPDGYIALTLVPTSPIYPFAGPFLKILFSMPGVVLSPFQSTVNALHITAYSVPLSIEVCVWFYEALGKDLRCQTQKVQRIQNLFIANPSIKGALVVADVFATAGFSDSLSLLFGTFAVLQSHFYLAFVIAFRYYGKMDVERKAAFSATLTPIVAAFPYKSRAKSLFAVTVGLVDFGFQLALAETSNPDLLEAIRVDFEKPPLSCASSLEQA
jgi:hypothetical protein